MFFTVLKKKKSEILWTIIHPSVYGMRNTAVGEINITIIILLWY